VSLFFGWVGLNCWGLFVFDGCVGSDFWDDGFFYFYGGDVCWVVLFVSGFGDWLFWVVCVCGNVFKCEFVGFVVYEEVFEMNVVVEWFKENWMLVLAILLIFLMASLGWVVSQ